MLRERRPHRCFGAEANGRSCGAATVTASRGTAGRLVRPRRGVAPASRRRSRGGDRRGTAPARLNPKGRCRVRTERVRLRRPLDVTSTMTPKTLLAVCGACAVTGAPAAAALATAGPAPAPASLAPHSPIAAALTRRHAEHDVLRLARRKARASHRHVGREYVRRVQTWPLARLRRERHSLLADLRELRRTGGAPNVPVPPVLRSIAAVRVGRQPARRQRRRRLPRQVPVRLRDVGARRRQRRPGGCARGRAGPPRGHALRPRRLLALARLRPVDSLPRVDATALRAEFPVLSDRAYLNAGTCGPLPHASVRATLDLLDRGAALGRAREYVDTMIELRDGQRVAYAGVLGADVADVALTTCTSDGVVRVLAGLELGPGDEVLTAPDEHPGLLGPLVTLRARRGVDIRAVPFADLADAVGPRTKLVACSHVSWTTGSVRPSGLAALDIPVLLDGAQGVGAIGFDVGSLGCAFYAGSGQKWLCGPVGSGMLWVAPEWRSRVAPMGATYMNLAKPATAWPPSCSPTPAATTPRHRPRDGRGGGRRPRCPGLASDGPRSTRARPRSPPCSPRGSQRPAEPSRRAGRPRSCRWRTPIPRRPATASPRPASSCATAGDGVPARLGGRVERRGRPRASARRPLTAGATRPRPRGCGGRPGAR